MKGFFKKNKVSRKGVKDQIQNPCAVCGLSKSRVTEGICKGEGEKKILIIGETPGDGKATQFLRENLKLLGIKLNRDCWKINAINCKTEKVPSKKQIKACRWSVDKAISTLQPEFIFLMGGAAIASMYAGRFTELTVTRWRKLCIPDKMTNAWVIPMYHPSFILKSKFDVGLENLFKRDLKWAVSCLKKKPPVFEDFESQVEKITDHGTIIDRLEEIIETQPMIAIDYEASGLKPFKKGHKVVSIAVTTEDFKTFAFPFDCVDWLHDERDHIFTLWSHILVDPKIKKIAHNVGFEGLWCRVIFNSSVRGWHWCTMNAAHVLDDRPKYTGLKFQSYIRFGIEGYEEKAKPYIKAKNGSEFNTMHLMPIDDLLLYNGLDTLLTMHLYKYQKKIISREINGRAKGLSLTMQGTKALTDIQCNGIQMDEIYYRETDWGLSEEIKKLNQKLLTGPEAKQWKKAKRKTININSPKDLKELFFDIQKLKPTRFTPAGEPSVDREVLETLDSDFARQIVNLRKQEKIKGTYLAQFEREIINGKIHPWFNLSIARTYRSSSSNPNFQNIPVRDELAKAYIRKGIIPSPGNKILCLDYGSIEVRVIACYTKDKQLLSYIYDETTDMHRDQAMKCFSLNKKTVTKDLRSITKSSFVFPQFYGSYYASCARDLWNEGGVKCINDGTPIIEHLINKRIIWNDKDYDRFEKHIKNVETDFWQRFPDVRAWQDDMINFYNRNGYVEILSGYRRSGHLTKNMIINTPIQGFAFHLLLWSLIKLNRIAKRKWKSKVICQIHDELVIDLHPDEEEEVIQTAKQVMEIDVRDHFPEVIVPLVIEAEITEIDQSWYYKKELKI